MFSSSTRVAGVEKGRGREEGKKAGGLGTFPLLSSLRRRRSKPSVYSYINDYTNGLDECVGRLQRRLFAVK